MKVLSAQQKRFEDDYMNVREITIITALLLAVVSMKAFIKYSSRDKIRQFPSNCEFVKISYRTEDGGADFDESFICAVGGIISTEYIPEGCEREIFNALKLKTGDWLVVNGCLVEFRRMKGKELLTLGLRIDINRASVEDLDAVPLISKSVAANIVSFREENGAFRELDDLLAVRGIGEKTLKRIRNFVEIVP